MRRYRSVSGGFDESPEGGWVRYSDVQKLRENMMAMAEFQQQLGDARGFRRGVQRCKCTPKTVDMLIREDRA
jgi:hypothetical protein